ncbi:glycosyltransferase family 9 protein [Maridesulfovibrio salexigens]|uniref:Glycosyl transferase family 9 n=1 Tax=Maridesulfovibrio salexigens (strain ATCC 14822 / DSM 2638 / NCIMB 8403 / VKM B-1763) TaxID=526222 RepID=C6BTY7_MARSD|nr:glycosyltransferase family 9 protein [Maridesulfovibrio salexigens]ACS81696.1 glycosyl transferase family 9 [Maridesulfovibrio salexigens DSM 2638]
MKDISSINPKKILVCQLRQIGDVVLATPSVSLLQKKYPDAEIHVLTEGKCTQVFDNNPAVSHVWAIDKKKLRNPLKALAFYWRVGRSGYDLIVDFQQLPRCRWVVLFSDAPVKLADMPPWYNRWLYTNWPEYIPGGYAAMYKAGVLKPLGIEWNSERPKIYTSDEERAEAKDCLDMLGVADDEPLITIDASHRRHTRKWPEEYYGKLIRLIAEQRPNFKFFLLYGPGEKDVAIKVMEESGVADKCVMVDKPGSLRLMAALIERAVLHIGNCSAPRHFAVAVGTQSIVMPGSSGSWIFPSPEHEEVVAGIECEPCGKEKCDRGDLACLTKVLPEDVLLRVLDRV